MRGLENPTYLVAWIVSNLVAAVILWAAVKKPRCARGLLFLLFGWACWTNFTIVHGTPEVYLEYATMSIGWYTDFIRGWFSSRIVPVVTVIAIGQGLIAVGMLLRGVWLRLACVGAIVFLISIAPLGVGSGFPFPLTVAYAAWLVARTSKADYLWTFASRSRHPPTVIQG